jgi:hypothetical protein
MTQAAPAVPHAVVDGVVHVVPAQHPVGHVVELQPVTTSVDWSAGASPVAWSDGESPIDWSIDASAASRPPSVGVVWSEPESVDPSVGPSLPCVPSAMASPEPSSPPSPTRASDPLLPPQPEATRAATTRRIHVAAANVAPRGTDRFMPSSPMESPAR